ncbi:MAG: 4-(cytidine 5'-diphospho)-2-C-methyl-D-erythritol kinase [Chthoniobacterales bacterium]|nr:4-(cytidine 5'-diphospho)-2-C-methyl-D-erythritol kinase [Chthoniobacterales bacterium]
MSPHATNCELASQRDDRVTLLAPAKINLSLKLFKKREDGFYELETLMAPLSLADEIEITLIGGAVSQNVTLLCNEPSLPTGTDNLCVRAAHAFQQATGIDKPVVITLLKKVPHGAGLGGGSSDAAVVLRGMNELFQEPLVMEELQELSSSLGSDVPFFLDPQPRWCHGRGEVLGECVALPAWKLLLIKPPFPIATSWAYGQVADREKNSHLSSSCDHQLVDGITIFNDLEAPVFEKYLLLPLLKNWLQKRSEVRAAWMSGSGSTMVALLQETITMDQTTLLKEAIIADSGKTFWLKEVTATLPAVGRYN